MLKRINLTFIIGILLCHISNSQNIYPDNEDGQYEDMLTPKYYLNEKGHPFRHEINKFVHFARQSSFNHPFQDSLGQKPKYTIRRAFGDGIGANNSSQHHPACDMHLENRISKVYMYAAYDGLVNIYRNSPKYRQHLSLTKSIKDSSGIEIGKIVTIYAHIDLDLDSIDNLLLDGQYVKRGDVISRHLYSGTKGGPHLHFEIRYYRPNDDENEEYYGPRKTQTNSDLSAGSWSFGYWNPSVAYGYANPNNYLIDSITQTIEYKFIKSLKVYPNPTTDHVKIRLNNKYDLNIKILVFNTEGRLLDKKIINAPSLINLDISHYKIGLYFIQLINLDTNNSTVMKMVKK